MLDKKNKKLTHIDSSGKANMVEISNKEIVSRTAKARGKIYLSKETIKLIKENNITAQIYYGNDNTLYSE